MVAPDFSAAVALCDKAEELLKLGHFARAATKYALAVDSALAQGCPDCLIVARLRLQHAMIAVEGTGADAVAEELTAATTIQRRLAAGTLLGAGCTAAELAWHRAELEHKARVDNNTVLRQRVPQLALLFGYTTVLNCAASLLVNVRYQCSVMTPEQVATCWNFIADAVDCVAQPRACEDMASSAEGTFVKYVRELLSDPPEQCIVPRDELGARLRDAWQRLESSGVLQRRSIDAGIQMGDAYRNATEKAADAAEAAPGLRCCGLATCGAREQHPKHFKACGACRIPAYCCKEHQTEHWPDHKAACKAARKGKAAADDGAGPSGA